MYRLWWSVWHVPLSCLSPVASRGLCASQETHPRLPFFHSAWFLDVAVVRWIPSEKLHHLFAFPKHVAKWTGLVRTRDQEIATCSCEFVSSFSFSFTGVWQAPAFITVWVWMTRTWTQKTGMPSVVLGLHISDALMHVFWGLLLKMNFKVGMKC